MRVLVLDVFWYGTSVTMTGSAGTGVGSLDKSSIASI